MGDSQELDELRDMVATRDAIILEQGRQLDQNKEVIDLQDRRIAALEAMIQKLHDILNALIDRQQPVKPRTFEIR